MYGYRCHALYYIGAYEAAVRDGRNALECERIAGCKRTLLSALGSSPYTTAGQSSASSNLLHPEKGSVLRAKVLTFLACSLLRQGILEGVADAFDGSMDVASKALEDAEDLTEGERMSSVTHEHAVSVAKSTIQQAKEGLKTMERYEALKTKLEHNSRGKYSIADFDEALSIAPAAVVFHEEKLKFLIGRKRWFSVANHCEQMAANAVKMDGVHVGDLADLDPFPGISPVEELSAEIFEERSGGGKGGGLPPYLRTLSTKAACDAVFRLPKEIVPYYLRSLRLEERYGAAVKAGRALMDFDAQAEKEQDLAKFVDRKILSREVDKLERTIKLKEEGDALFRDGYFDRAAALYGECLVIDEEGNNSGSNGSLGRASSVRFGDVSGSKAFAKAASAGGRLHAILHSNRAACFSSLGRYQDAVVESSHAIEIHNMYMKAILRRARCFAKIGENNRAQTDFNRWLALVHGSKSMPFPPLNQGPACFFDMPSEVSKQEVNAVKSEMNELGLSPPIQNPSMRNRMSINPPNISLRKPNSRGSSIRRKKRGMLRRYLESISSFFESLGCPACMKRDVREQIVVNEPARGSTRSMAGTQYGDNLRDSNKSGRSTSSSRSVSGRSTSSRSTSSKSISSAPQRSSLKKDPPASVNPLIKSRPAFDHPLDPPSEM